MRSLYLLWSAVVCVQAAAAAPVDDAKKAQAEGKVRHASARSSSERAAAKLRELRRVLEGVVDALEKEGVTFDKIQGDSVWNPLPEAVPSKVALEKLRKPPQLILLPSGGERVYATIAARQGGWLVTLESGGAKKTAEAPEKLDGAAPKLRELLLALIARK